MGDTNLCRLFPAPLHAVSVAVNQVPLGTDPRVSANVFGYTYGSISAVIMGAGMSLVMTDIGAMIGLTATMVPGVAIGVVGMGMALTTYPIYKKILTSRKKKYANKIMELSERVMKG